MQPGHKAGLRNKKSQHTLAMVTRAAGFKLFCPYAPSEKRFAFLRLGLTSYRKPSRRLGKAYARMNITWPKSVKQNLFQVERINQFRHRVMAITVVGQRLSIPKSVYLFALQ